VIIKWCHYPHSPAIKTETPGYREGVDGVMVSPQQIINGEVPEYIRKKYPIVFKIELQGQPPGEAVYHAVRSEQVADRLMDWNGLHQKFSGSEHVYRNNPTVENAQEIITRSGVGLEESIAITAQLEQIDFLPGPGEYHIAGIDSTGVGRDAVLNYERVGDQLVLDGFQTIISWQEHPDNRNLVKVHSQEIPYTLGRIGAPGGAPLKEELFLMDKTTKQIVEHLIEPNVSAKYDSNREYATPDTSRLGIAPLEKERLQELDIQLKGSPGMGKWENGYETSKYDKLVQNGQVVAVLEKAEVEQAYEQPHYEYTGNAYLFPTKTDVFMHTNSSKSELTNSVLSGDAIRVDLRSLGNEKLNEDIAELNLRMADGVAELKAKDTDRNAPYSGLGSQNSLMQQVNTLLDRQGWEDKVVKDMGLGQRLSSAQTLDLRNDIDRNPNLFRNQQLDKGFDSFDRGI
jgi:hypothetical protein